MLGIGLIIYCQGPLVEFCCYFVTRNRVVVTPAIGAMLRLGHHDSVLIELVDL